MKRTIRIIALLTFFGLSNCEPIDILPAEGMIEGIVTDNNGAPLDGVQVSAAFEAPSESGQAVEETHITSTDVKGHYRFIELWDEVSLSIAHPGFRPAITQVDLGEKYHPQVDIILEGSPTILSIVPSTTTLSTSSQDILIVNIEVSDSFNTGEQFYEVNLLLQNDANITRAILPAISTFSGQQQFLFEVMVNSTELQLPAGSYTLTVEAIDSDGNLDRRQAGQKINID